MTEKKEKILDSALILFANEGFAATSTSKVAQHAGVSEGLIFRHFGNKYGLLDAIIKEGEERAKKLFSTIVFESDPKEVIRKTIGLIDIIAKSKEDFEFWKLQYKIKWETEKYGEQKLEAIHHALEVAFTELRYEMPVEEAQMLLITIDGFATRLCLQKEFKYQSLVKYLRRKYKV